MPTPSPPYLVLSPPAPEWTRVCPRGVEIRVVVRRSDGLALGYTSDTLYRTGRINLSLVGANGVSVGSQSFYMDAAQTSLMAIFQVAEAPPGLYRILATRETLLWDNSGYDGGGMDPGYYDLLITNAYPVGSHVACSIATLAYQNLVVQTDCVFSDECPLSCTNQVWGKYTNYDWLGNRLSGPYSMGSQTVQAGHSILWEPVSGWSFLVDPRADHATFDFDAMTTDTFGYQSQIYRGSVSMFNPAIRQWGGWGDGRGGGGQG